MRPTKDTRAVSACCMWQDVPLACIQVSRSPIYLAVFCLAVRTLTFWASYFLH